MAVVGFEHEYENEILLHWTTKLKDLPKYITDATKTCNNDDLGLNYLFHVFQSFRGFHQY